MAYLADWILCQFARDIADVVGGSDDTIWLSYTIAITTCVLGPPVAQAADYWGRKWFIIILTFFGVIGCIIVSRATSMGMAIGGEVMAGLAFGSQPLLYGVSSEILPRKWRPIAQGGMNVSIGLAGIFTLLVGLSLTQNNPVNFRIFFYITAGVQAVAALIFAFLYNPPLRPLQSSLSLREKLHKVGYFNCKSLYALLTCANLTSIAGLDRVPLPCLRGYSSQHRPVMVTEPMQVSCF